MKVIVKQSGFYGGEWFNTASEAVEMNDEVAKLSMPPFGNDLELPKAIKPSLQASALKTASKV